MTFVHTPANWLTLLRLLCTPFVVILTLYGSGYAAVLFALLAVGDGLDGWVARTFACESRWGELADPIADKVLSHATLAAITVKTMSIALLALWGMLIARDTWLTYARLACHASHPVSRTAKIKSAALSLALFFLLTGNLFASNLVYQIGFVILLLSTYLSLISFRDYLRLADKS